MEIATTTRPPKQQQSFAYTSFANSLHTTFTRNRHAMCIESTTKTQFYTCITMHPRFQYKYHPLETNQLDR